MKAKSGELKRGRTGRATPRVHGSGKPSKTTKASIEDRLIASAKQAVAISRGEMAPSKSYVLPLTARSATVAAPRAYTRMDVQRIRERLGVSQDLFAQLLAKSTPTVRSWEQGQREPDPAANRLLEIAERHPEVLLELMTSKSG